MEKVSEYLSLLLLNLKFEKAKIERHMGEYKNQTS